MKFRFILCLLILGGMVYGDGTELTYDGVRYRGEIEKQFNVDCCGKLVLDDIVGDVDIVGEARNDISITEIFSVKTYSEATAQKTVTKNKSKFIQKGNTIVVEGQERSGKFNSRLSIRLPIKFNIQVETAGGDVSVEDIDGDVEVKTSGGDVIMNEIDGKLQLHTSGGDIDIDDCSGEGNATTSGGDILIEDYSGEIQATTSGGDIDISHFSGTGTIKTSGGDIDLLDVNGYIFEATTSGGDIDVDQASVKMVLKTNGGDIGIGKSDDDIKAWTSGGDIDVSEINGNLAATTSGGDIYVQTVKGMCILKTSGGDIDVNTALNSMDAETSGGSISISGVLGYVNASTSGGDIDIRKLYRENITQAGVDLNTSGGDIRLYLPDQSDAEIAAIIKITNRNEDDYEIDSDFPLNIEKISKNGLTYIKGSGKVNNGGNDVRLANVNGDIEIVRELK